MTKPCTLHIGSHNVLAFDTHTVFLCAGFSNQTNGNEMCLSGSVLLGVWMQGLHPKIFVMHCCTLADFVWDITHRDQGRFARELS